MVLILWLAPLVGRAGGSIPEGPQQALWSALQRLTGATEKELQLATQELSALSVPSQRPTWAERVHCNEGWCAGEVLARLIAALGEAGVIPQRGFEPHKGDPLYDLWNEEDKQGFHSWQDGQVVVDDDPLSALIPEGQSLALGRLQAAAFMKKAKATIADMLPPWRSGYLGRCLEWDTPFYIVKTFGSSCTHFDMLQYANPRAGGKEEMILYPQQGLRVMSMDILQPPTWLPNDYGVIVCLFVLEHLPDPWTAMRNIERMLLPGGFLLLGAPFIDGVHGCPYDYLRYTPAGLLHLTEAVGLEVLWSFSPGGASITAGEMLGMKTSYWSHEQALQYSDTHPANVFLLARKALPSRPGRNRTWD